MIQRLLLLAGLVIFFSGCVTSSPPPPPPKVPISVNDKVAFISAIDPAMRGQKNAFTIFGYKNWVASDPGFDVNAISLSAAKTVLNREVKLVNGEDVGLIMENEYINTVLRCSVPSTDSPPVELMQKLTTLGREWQVAYILLFQTATTQDWTWSQPYGEWGTPTGPALEGFGQHGRYGRTENSLYGIFWLRIFDCEAGQFVNCGAWATLQLRPLPSVPWHNEWSDYTPNEKQIFPDELAVLIKQSLSVLLSQTYLTNAVNQAQPIYIDCHY
jgi:hypothetical protein